MSDSVMPDFERRLEVALVQEAGRTRRRRRMVQVGALVAPAAAVLAVVLVIPDGGGMSPGVAEARPLPKIVYEPAAARTPTDAEVGVADAQIDEARAFAVRDETGYVVPRSNGTWCISVPDLATRQPSIERGTACAATQRELQSFGLSVRVGPVVAVAIASGAPAPTLTRNSSAKPVPVNGDGIAVITDLAPGDKLTIHGSDGGERSYVGAGPEDEPTVGVCEDGRRFDLRKTRIRDACGW